MQLAAIAEKGHGMILDLIYVSQGASFTSCSGCSGRAGLGEDHSGFVLARYRLFRHSLISLVPCISIKLLTFATSHTS